MKIATIGTGMIVDLFLDACSQNNIECVAMYTRDQAHAKTLATKYNINKIFTDFNEFLQCNDYNFVYIASPNSLHYSHAKQALQANKHVICEKPFTSNVKEFLALKEYAIKHHLFLFEAIVNQYVPNYQKIKEIIPKLGDIKIVQCNFSQYSSKYDAFQNGELPNVFNPKFSGGALADIGIYNLHFIIGLFDMPNDVYYYPNLHKNGIDTSGVCILQYPSFIATCVACKDSSSKNIAQIQGTLGCITIESETSRCNHYTYTIQKEVHEDFIEQNNNILFYEVKAFKALYEQNDFNTCYQQLNHSENVMKVYEALRKNAKIEFEVDK